MKELRCKEPLLQLACHLSNFFTSKSVVLFTIMQKSGYSAGAIIRSIFTGSTLIFKRPNFVQPRL